MDYEGPLLESLTRRLAETPSEFLAEPRIGKLGQVQVAAVVADVLRELGGWGIGAAQLQPFISDSAQRDRNRLSLTLIACWLLHDDWFIQQSASPAIYKVPGMLAEAAMTFLINGPAELAALNNATRFISDPDRREELVRVMLKQLNLRPAGETLAQAQDRLSTLNSAERQRVIKATREAEARAQAVREALAKQAAEEAAAKYNRE